MAEQGDESAKIDFTIMRTDLIVDCIRSTSSPQVQNAALLLVASLAEIAPDLVLHSVMPIFTFISSTVFRQDDDYSVYVIDQVSQDITLKSSFCNSCLVVDYPPRDTSISEISQEAKSGSRCRHCGVTSELHSSFQACSGTPATSTLHVSPSYSWGR